MLFGAVFLRIAAIDPVSVDNGRFGQIGCPVGCSLYFLDSISGFIIVSSHFPNASSLVVIQVFLPKCSLTGYALLNPEGVWRRRVGAVARVRMLMDVR
mgnify:CR=1 FL=1